MERARPITSKPGPGDVVRRAVLGVRKRRYTYLYWLKSKVLLETD